MLCVHRKGYVGTLMAFQDETKSLSKLDRSIYDILLITRKRKPPYFFHAISITLEKNLYKTVNAAKTVLLHYRIKS